MPYRRRIVKRNYRKAAGKNRRQVGKRVAVARRYAPSTGTLHLKRMCFVTDITAVGAQNFWFMNFRLNQLPSWGEITELFQQYRINCVVVKFFPMYDGAPVGATAANRIPIMHMATDFINASPWTSAQDAFQMGNLRSVRADKPFSYKFAPRAILDAYAGGVSGNSSLPKAKQWVSSADAAVWHYGLKGFLDCGAANTGLVIKAYATFYISAKQVR